MAMLCGQAAKLCGHHLRLCSNFVICLNQSANKLTSPTSPHLTLLRHFSSTLQDIDVECSERNWLQELLAWNILLSDAVDNLCKLTLLTSSASTWHMSKSIERCIEHSFSLKLPFLQELRKMRNTLLARGSAFLCVSIAATRLYNSRTLAPFESGRKRNHSK